MKFNWDNVKLDRPEDLIEESVHVGTPAQVPGIELKAQIKITGLAVTVVLENSNKEMETVTVNTGSTNTPTVTTQMDDTNR